MPEEVKSVSSEEPESERLFLLWNSLITLPLLTEVILSSPESGREPEREMIFMRKCKPSESSNSTESPELLLSTVR